MKHVMSVATVFAVFLSYTATAGRYWSGTADDAAWSLVANWSESSGGTAGASVPDSNSGTTYFRNLHNGFVVFDAAATLGSNNVRVDTGSETPFVWRATEAANGFTTSGELRICEDVGKSPAHLKIESGTYEAKYLRVGYAENSVASLVMDGGTLTLSAESSVGYASGCTAEMVINEGATVNAVQYFYVGQNGVGKMTMNGGAFTMANLDGGGFSLCRRNDGASGTLELNGGTLTLPNFRVEFNRSASNYPNNKGRIVFNGGTVVPTKSNASFLSDADNLTCEIAAGGLIVDTAGFDITIAHPLVGAGGIVKRGIGTLRLSGANTFTGGITVEEGSVVDTDGTEYKPGNEPATSTTVIDASEGGDLGTVQLHRNPLAKWLADCTTYASQYGAVGAECLETPRYIKVTVGGESKTYMNLKTGETVADELGGQSYTFTSESAAPRTIRIDAPNGIVANVRDVGSWPIVSVGGTKKMNQGVVFRGGKLDGFIGASAEQRAASWLTAAGLKTEIDLRAASQDQPSALVGATESPAADGCAYLNCGLDWAGTQISADSDGNFTNQMRRVFAALGSEGALPAYFHCAIGTDRTGITGLLLLGLMGVEEETLYRDYLMSNFANIGGSRSPSVVDTFLRYIHRGNCNGGKYRFADNDYGLSVAARCRAYLEMCGVTAGELGRITAALSGETPAEVLQRVNAYETANGYRTVSYIPYSGEAPVAAHRFAANGTRIMPTSVPTRVGYTFKGWDVDNETDNGDGTATVYAIWDAGETPDRDPLTFKWDNNGGTYKLADGDNWYVSGLPSDNRQRGTPAIIDTAIFENHSYASLDEGAKFFARSLELKRWGGIARLDITNATFRTAEVLRIGASGGSSEVNIYDDAEVEAGFVEVSFWNSFENCTLNVYGGALTANAPDWTGAPIIVGKQASADNEKVRGVMNVSGGVVTSVGDIKVGYGATGGAASRESASRLDISGGKVVGNSLGVAEFQSSAAGLVSVSGGELSLSGDLNISGKSQSWGEVAVSGGSITVPGTIRVGNHADALHSVFVISGGTVDVGTLSVARDCDGTVSLTGGKLYATKIEQSSSAPAAAVSCIYSDGGEIVAKSDNDSFMTRLDDVSLGAGGLTIDDAGCTVKLTSTCTFSGVGGITKKGSGTVKLDSTYNAHGVIAVKEGTLRLPANATIYCEGTNVAQGATLNLNGATIVIVTKKIVSSVWTNAGGDGDTMNPQNWRSDVAYFGEDGEEIPALAAAYDFVSPSLETSVRIPVGPDMPSNVSGLNVASLSYVVDSDVSFIISFDSTYDEYEAGDIVATGEVKVLNSLNGLLKAADAWYDPSDAVTLTIGDDGFVSAVANKGYRGSAMDAKRRSSSGAAVVSADEFRINGLNTLVFTNNYGYTSAEKLGTLDDDQPRALFAVSARQVIGDFAATVEGDPEHNSAEVMGIEIANAGFTGADQPGYCGLDQVNWGNRARMHVVKDDGEEKSDYEASFGSSPEGRPIVLTLNAKATSASSAERYWSDNDHIFKRNTNEVTYQKLVGGADMGVDYGWRAQWNCKSKGRLGEALAYKRDLSDAASEAVEKYLAAKWLGDESAVAVASATEIERLFLEDAKVDFDGADVVVGTLGGFGEIVNAKSMDIRTLSFEYDAEKSCAAISFAGDLNISETEVTISPALFAAVKAVNEPVSLLETSGKIVAGNRRHYVYATRRYVVWAENGADGGVLKIGMERGLSLCIR